MDVKAAIAVHHTATTDEPWDGPAAVAGMPNDAAALRYCHAWVDSSGDASVKGSFKFPHHKTKGGPANLSACRNGLARLSGADIPSGDVAGVRAHLQAHLDDAKKSAEGTTVSVKSLRGVRVEIKDADRGEVDAVFATLGVKDSDGDVTLPGAFEAGAPVVISAYGHASWGGALPVGKGTIREVKNEAIMSGQFFMDTTHGRDTFLTVKGLGPIQNWSYGYDPVDYSFGEFEGDQVRFLAKQQVHEVSPTLLGAGVNTRTLGTKGASTFIGEATAVLAAATALADRAADVMAKRAEKGKGLGADSAAVLDQIVAQCKRLTDARDPGPDPSEELQAAIQREFLRSLRRIA